MHDAVFVLIEGLNKFRRKGEKSNSRRSGSGGTGGGPSSSNQQPNATLDCNSSQGLVSHWEFGEKIAKSLRKVSRVGGIETLPKWHADVVLDHLSLSLSLAMRIGIYSRREMGDSRVND